MEINTILTQLKINPQLGNVRKLAKDIKINHELALELWSSNNFHAEMLAILLFDPKKIDENLIDIFDNSIIKHTEKERNQLTDWLLANYFLKSKKGINFILSWENNQSTWKRRLFWYYQGRLRWMGKNTENNTEYLLSSIEKNIINEKPEVQWAMNFTAGWIGVYEEAFRNRVVQLGETTELYKFEKYSKNCTPNYLPLFVKIESEKRNT